MSRFILKFSFLLVTIVPLFLKAQMKPIEKVYIVEGIVADRETLKVIPSAIIFNDTLGITTTSDENGYFKVVVPYSLFSERQLIQIDIVKKGYKRNGWGIGSFHFLKGLDTTERTEIWNFDVQILLMAKSSSADMSTSMAHIPVNENMHGYPMIKQTFDQAVTSEKRYRKLEKQKQGNENIYFLIDGWVIFSTGTSDAYLEKPPLVFIDGEKQT